MARNEAMKNNITKTEPTSRHDKHAGFPRTLQTADQKRRE